MPKKEWNEPPIWSLFWKLTSRIWLATELAHDNVKPAYTYTSTITLRAQNKRVSSSAFYNTAPRPLVFTLRTAWVLWGWAIYDGIKGRKGVKGSVCQGCVVDWAPAELQNDPTNGGVISTSLPIKLLSLASPCGLNQKGGCVREERTLWRSQSGQAQLGLSCKAS